jgi:hypothetical protein
MHPEKMMSDDASNKTFGKSEKHKVLIVEKMSRILEPTHH